MRSHSHLTTPYPVPLSSAVCAWRACKQWLSGSMVPRSRAPLHFRQLMKAQPELAKARPGQACGCSSQGVGTGQDGGYGGGTAYQSPCNAMQLAVNRPFTGALGHASCTIALHDGGEMSTQGLPLPAYDPPQYT